MSDKKTFFERPTEAQIRNSGEEVALETDLISRLENLVAGEYALITEGTINLRQFGGGRKFLKHGPHTPIRRFRSIDEAIQEGKTPTELLKHAIENPSIRTRYRSGFTFKPVFTTDKMIRRVRLFEVLEAARIMAYGKEQPSAVIRVEGNYQSSTRVSIDGASFLVSTPSRRKRHRRHAFTLSGIPVIGNSRHVYVTPYNFASRDVAVESKTFDELRFTYQDSREGSKYYPVQAHEIAGNYAIAEAEHNNGNDTPGKFIVFPVPTQRLVNLYRTLNERTILQKRDKSGKLYTKLLNQEDIEVVLWGLSLTQGFDAAFDQNALVDGRLREYSWKSR